MIAGISKVFLAYDNGPGLRTTPWVLAQPHSLCSVTGGLGRSCSHLSRPGLPEMPWTKAFPSPSLQGLDPPLTHHSLLEARPGDQALRKNRSVKLYNADK